MACGVFCALDTPERASALATLRRLNGLPVHVKLGLEFFVAEGPSGVSSVRAEMPQDSLLFLDLKLHDIPNTVEGAVRAAMKCAPDFLTVHAAGGRAMMQAAMAAAKAAPRPAKILAVTVLTALDDNDLAETGQQGPAQEQVLRLARLAQDCGVDGLVCSPQEIAFLRRELGQGPLLVVPGIRPEKSESSDQKRTLTPEEAARAGADYLVIGRPVTQAPDPAQAASNILKSIENIAG